MTIQYTTYPLPTHTARDSTLHLPFPQGQIFVLLSTMFTSCTVLHCLASVSSPSALSQTFTWAYAYSCTLPVPFPACPIASGTTFCLHGSFLALTLSLVSTYFAFRNNPSLSTRPRLRPLASTQSPGPWPCFDTDGYILLLS